MIAWRVAAVGAGLAALAAAGSAVAEGDVRMRRTNVSEAVICAPAAEVWRALATADGWARMGAEDARLDLRPGGALVVGGRTADGSAAAPEVVRTVLALEPGAMLALAEPRTVADSAAPCRRWTVLRLRDVGDGRTRVAETEFELGVAGTARADTAGDSGADTVIARLARAFPAAAPSRPGAPPLEFSARIHAPPADVFRAWTTQAGVESFFADRAIVRLERGGPYEILFDPTRPAGEQGSEGCSVLAWLPGRMLSFTWNAPPHFVHARNRHTFVVVEFESEGDGETQLRLTHLGWEERIAQEPDHADEWRKVREYFAAAWPTVLASAQDSIRASGRTAR